MFKEESRTIRSGGSLAIRDGRFEANQFPLSTKTSVYVNDFQNFIFALTAPKTVE